MDQSQIQIQLEVGGWGGGGQVEMKRSVWVFNLINHSFINLIKKGLPLLLLFFPVSAVFAMESNEFSFVNDMCEVSDQCLMTSAIINCIFSQNPKLMHAHLKRDFPASTPGLDKVAVDALDGQEDNVGIASGPPGTSQQLHGMIGHICSKQIITCLITVNAKH